MLLWWLGCASSPNIDAILAYEWQGDGHAVVPVPLGAIEDPVTMTTQLGPGRRGGFLREIEDGAELRGGEAVHLRHIVDDGVFVPQDEQGLMFSSFFHHAEGLRQEMVDYGFGEAMDELFPVDGVFFSLSLVSELANLENAAFLSTGDAQAFLLFPDANRDVPLAAHIGVVRHELSHGFVANAIDLFRFENRNVDIISAYDRSAVNEGFADLLPVLTLDDPKVIPLPEREVDVFRDLSFVDDEDFYTMGTVIASFVWRIRERVGDADETLLLAVDALERWEDEAWFEGETTAVRYADLFATVVINAHPEIRSFVCRQFQQRFFEPATSCS